MCESGWTYEENPVTGSQRLTVVVTESDLMSMPREKVEMLQDAAWLVKAAFEGRTAGPLTLPHTGIPIR
jgi:hypothetical protein